MVLPTELPSTEEHERREWLIRVLGEPVCRQLGIYRIPDDLVLSVVIPVYNERNTIHEILRQVRAVPVDEADHPGRRLLDGRHPRDPPADGGRASPT